MTNKWKRRLLIFCTLLVIMLAGCGENAQKSWQMHYDLGMQYLEDGDYEHAIVAFTAAIEIDPKQAVVYVARADTYVDYVKSDETIDHEEMFKQAIADYDKALELTVTDQTKSEDVKNIKEKLELVKEQIASEKSQENVSAIDIACKILNLRPIDQEVILQYQRKDDYYSPRYEVQVWASSTTLEYPAILFAHMDDYDNDNENEILIAVLEGSEKIDNSIRLCMLEQDNNGWQISDQINVTGHEENYGIYPLYANPQNINIYANAQKQIFLESASDARFGDGFGWQLLSYQYTNGAWIQVEDEIFFAGSDGIGAILSMNPEEAWDEDEKLYAIKIIDQIHSLGLNPQEINLDIAIPDTDLNVERYCKLSKTDETLDSELDLLYEESPGSTEGRIILRYTNYIDDL